MSSEACDAAKRTAKSGIALSRAWVNEALSALCLSAYLSLTGCLRFCNEYAMDHGVAFNVIRGPCTAMINATQGVVLSLFSQPPLYQYICHVSQGIDRDDQDIAG